MVAHAIGVPQEASQDTYYYFSKIYKKYYRIHQRFACAVGVSQEASLEPSRILTKYSLKSKIGF